MAWPSGRWIVATNHLLQTWIRPSLDPGWRNRTPTDVCTPVKLRDATGADRDHSTSRTERLRACDASVVPTHPSLLQPFDVETTDLRRSPCGMLRWLPCVLSTRHRGTTLPRQFPRSGIELTCTKRDRVLRVFPHPIQTGWDRPSILARQGKATKHPTHDRETQTRGKMGKLGCMDGIIGSDEMHRDGT